MHDMEARDAGAGSGALTVMVVSPLAELRTRLVSKLACDPAIRSTAEAWSFHAALSSLRGARFDVLFIDVDPPADGLHVLRRVARELPKSVVVALTSAADPFFRERCAALGADFVVSKPQDLDRIADVMLALRVSAAS